MSHTIVLVTIENARIKERCLSVMHKSPLAAVARRAAELAFEHFGNNRVVRDDGSLSAGIG